MQHTKSGLAQHCLALPPHLCEFRLALSLREAGRITLLLQVDLLELVDCQRTGRCLAELRKSARSEGHGTQQLGNAVSTKPTKQTLTQQADTTH